MLQDIFLRMQPSKQNVSYPFRAWVDVKDLDGITAAEQAKLVDRYKYR